MTDSAEETTRRWTRGSKRRKQGARGLGLINAVTLVFVALKLTDQIDWSWWWVFSPQWISLAFATAAILVIWVAAGFANLVGRARA